MSRKRVLLYACLALAVPLPAVALDAGSRAASLDVQATQGSCGIGGGSITCQIEASFNRLGDAEYYTASVTAPDGSVSDLGTVAEGGGTGRTSASLPVPYAGNGSYTVTITAYGYDESGRAERLGSDDTGAGKQSEKTGERELEAVEPPADVAPAPAPDEPPPGGEPTPVEPAPERPVCPAADSAAPPAEAQTTTPTTPLTPSDPCPAPAPEPEVEQVPTPAPPPE
jgi:hypothetical protein